MEEEEEEEKVIARGEGFVGTGDESRRNSSRAATATLSVKVKWKI